MLVPTSLAAIELARGRPDAALDALNAAAPYVTGTVAALIPVYLRGPAYLARGAGAPALEQFQKILDHRGTDPFSPVCALAYLGRARAWRLMGDHGASARAYAEFLALWDHADPDIPVLVQARQESHDHLIAGRPGDPLDGHGHVLQTGRGPGITADAAQPLHAEHPQRSRHGASPEERAGL